MSNCRWCNENKKHKEDCPNKDESLKTVVRKAIEGWVESNETVHKG